MSQNNITEQEWFQSCPSGVLALDSEGRICGANPALEEIIGLPAGRLLGHNRESLPSTIHACLFDNEELIHLHGPGLERWMQHRVRELSRPENGISSLHFYQDVTETRQLRQENERLHRHVEELAITDELTGLANKRALSRMLETQVTRSRRYQNPLSLALTEIIPGDGQASSLPHLPEELVLTVSCYLRDRLRWADVLGRWDGNRFMLMLPETPEDAARTLIDNIGYGVSDIATIGDGPEQAFRLHFGLVEWTKGLDARKLVKQAEQALDAAGAAAGAGN